MKSIVRHYRRYDGLIQCGTPSTRIDATGVRQGVTCKRCLKGLVARERYDAELERRRGS